MLYFLYLELALKYISINIKLIYLKKIDRKLIKDKALIKEPI
jgi:hypothetical protein